MHVPSYNLYIMYVSHLVVDYRQILHDMDLLCAKVFVTIDSVSLINTPEIPLKYNDVFVVC